MRHFSATQLKQHLDSGSSRTVLVDVREPWEFNICAIDNSQLIPMGQIASRIEQLNKDDEIVVICHHGIRSRAVAHYLEQQGFSDVINLTGGVEAWAREVDLDMPTY